MFILTGHPTSLLHIATVQWSLGRNQASNTGTTEHTVPTNNTSVSVVAYKWFYHEHTPRKCLLEPKERFQVLVNGEVSHFVQLF